VAGDPEPGNIVSRPLCSCVLDRPGWLTLGKELSSSNHAPDEWASHFEGSVESLSAEGEAPQMLPNHLLGTTPEIESLRPKSPTQLRDEASKKILKEVRHRHPKPLHT